MKKTFFPEVYAKTIYQCLFIAGLSGALAACGFTRQKGGSQADGIDPDFLDSAGELTLRSGKTPGYNTVRALVFKPQCIECHGSKGGVSVETYSGAKEAISRIANEVYMEKSMPPSGPLPAQAQAFVKAWVDGGAPEHDLSPGKGGPSTGAWTPIEPPVAVDASWTAPDGKLTVPAGAVPGFNTVKALVFNVAAGQCLKCHNNSHAAKKVNLQSYEKAVLHLDEIANETYVEKTMPPRKSGYVPIPQDQQDFVRAWIEGGAPQSDVLPASASTSPNASGAEAGGSDHHAG